MSESPKISLMHETTRHLQAGIEGAVDIWAHEGLKKGIETLLDHAGQSELGRWALERASGGPINDDRLMTSIGNLQLTGPIGLAPGWDKPGKTLAAWKAMGAHHVTPGAVTLWGQPGNRMPRLRTFDEYVGDHGRTVSLNSYGFSSPRYEHVVHNIARQREAGLIGEEVGMPVIVQVTLNKEMYEDGNLDHVAHWLGQTVRRVIGVADGINLGLSSPNTKGMRDQQRKEFIFRNIEATLAETPSGMTVVYKGDGDSDERLGWLAEAQKEYGIALELINTSALERLKAKYGAENLPGGLAGGDPEYQDLAVRAVRMVYEETGGDIIGVGGIGVGEPGQAVRLLRAGASALSVNTGVRTRGPRIMTSTDREIIEQLDTLPSRQDTLQHIIGADTARGPKALAA